MPHIRKDATMEFPTPVQPKLSWWKRITNYLGGK